MTDQPKNNKPSDKPVVPEKETGAKESVKPAVEANAKPSESAPEKPKPAPDNKAVSSDAKSGITSADSGPVSAAVSDKPAAPASAAPGKPAAVPAVPAEGTPAEKPSVEGSISATKPQDEPTKPGGEAKPADAPASVSGDASAKPADGPAAPAGAAPAPSSAGMQRCPNCGHRNRPGVLICENCGTNLVTGKTSVAGTRDLLREQEGSDTTASSGTGPLKGTAPLVDTSEMRAVQAAGSHVFEDNMVLRIEIEGGTTPIFVYPKQEIIFGRRDPTSGGMPDVDLTPYAGYRMGVSRRHSAIRLQDKRLDVSDLGSSNGTFLNGTRLSAHRPYQLRDGDEVRLGQMVMRVFFQTNMGRK